MIIITITIIPASGSARATGPREPGKWRCQSQVAYKVQQEKPLGRRLGGSGFCLAKALPTSKFPPTRGRETTWAVVGGSRDAVARPRYPIC